MEMYYEKVVEMHQNGYTPSAISKKINLDQDTILRWIPQDDETALQFFSKWSHMCDKLSWSYYRALMKVQDDSVRSSSLQGYL